MQMSSLLHSSYYIESITNLTLCQLICTDYMAVFFVTNLLPCLLTIYCLEVVQGNAHYAHVLLWPKYTSIACLESDVY